MKTLIKYVIAVALLLSVGACKKTLDLEIDNPNRIDEITFWKTPEDALMGINAVYGNFYRSGSPGSRWVPYYMDVRSDDGYSTSPWNELRSISALNITQYSFEVNYDTWWHHWRGIFRANQVIANVPGIEMDAVLRDRYVAEAMFIRALYYYNLVTIWGSIPLILEPSEPSDKPSQVPEEAVWAQIEKDLTEAAAALPLSYTGEEIGRATSGAAYALLGRVHLQQKEYQPAITALEWLITGPGQALYDLVPNYADNFRHTTENNKESVFEVQFKMRPENGGDDGPTSNVGTSRPPFFAPPVHGFNDANMHRWVVHEFLREPAANGQRDPRLAVTALYDSTDPRGPDFTQVYGSSFTSKNYDAGIKNRVWYHKYLDDYFRINEFEVFNSPINYRIIRFADVLLMYAEALNALGRTAEAYAPVDRVRERAGMTKLSVSRPGLNQVQFQQQLEHERITELTGEGLRWNDLARWGYFDDAAKLAILKARDPEFENFQIGRNKYMPIPQSELDINPNLVQNPNW
ncbi:MAG: RagB/SusD family nutrient uptake outer membrane protein [Bacteroidota bacterium]